MKEPPTIPIPLERLARSGLDQAASDAETLSAELQRARSETREVPQGTPFLDPSLIQPGTIIDSNYRVECELGRGGMGVVLRAHDVRLDRDVALKLIRSDLLTKGFRSRFVEEARAMARVNHPNVVGIHTFGEHAGIPYFVMELIEGRTLEEWLKSVSLPATTSAFEIMQELCLGVAAIHAGGTLHRDIKPSNVLLDGNLHPRIADLGVAVLYQRHPSAGPEVVGTPAYMAPEVAFPVEGTELSPRADVYSLACVAYELFTGQPLYKGEGGLELMVYHATEPIVPPTQIRPELPATLDDVLLAALEKDPSSRTESAEALAQGLAHAKETAYDPTRILIAEDDDDFRTLLYETLNKEFPHAVIACAANGQQALTAFDQEPASVAIFDLQMPVMDGIALTAILRSRRESAMMPIIVLTGAGGADEWKRLSSIGADRFLVKPVQLEDLVGLIRRSIRERSSVVP